MSTTITNNSSDTVDATVGAFQELHNLENKKNIFILVIEYIKKVCNFIGKLIKYIPILWDDENDFYRVLNLIKLELQYIDTDENKDLKIIIAHLDRYTDIYKYVDEDKNILDLIFKKTDPKIEKLEIWHLSSALKKLAKLAKGEHLRLDREVNNDEVGLNNGL